MDNTVLDPQRDYESLRTDPIDLNDRNVLVQKLNSTRELRKTLLSAKETDLREHFPFFLAYPQLVSVIPPLICCKENNILGIFIFEY